MSLVKKGLVLFVALVLGSVAQAQIVLLSEDFEAGSPPAGWSTTQNTPSVGWEFGTDLGTQYFPIPAHGRYAASNDDAHDDVSATANLADQDYLITPIVDLLAWAGTGIRLSFSYVQPSTWGSIGTVEIRIGGGPWVVLATVPQSTDWTGLEFDLSAYTTSTIVEIGFHHNDGGAWADGFAVDDVMISTVSAIDGAIDEILTSGYLPIGEALLGAVISNQGVVPITSVGLAIQINGGSIDNLTLAGFSVVPGGTLEFATTIDLPTVDTHQIEMWITAVNGLPDVNTSNNFASSEIITVSLIPPKKVILTNHSGAWAGYGPDGYVRLEQALALYGNLIGLSVHNSDAMEFPHGDILNTTYTNGYPTGLVDIFKFPEESDVILGRGVWNLRAEQRLNHTVPVSVSVIDVSYEPANREIYATVQAEFFGHGGEDLRFNLWIVEDGVTGAGSGYDQVNYYDTIPGHPYFGAGDPIIGFVHDRTLRVMLGGAWGTEGIIPPTVADGEVFTHQYSFVLPAEYDETRIKLIGLVSRYDDADIENRAILNSDERSLWSIFDDGFEWGDTLGWTLTSQ